IVPGVRIEVPAMAFEVGCTTPTVASSAAPNALALAFVLTVLSELQQRCRSVFPLPNLRPFYATTPLAALGLLSFATVAQAQAPAYLNQSALTGQLRALTASSPSATMTSLGTTIGGRDIWVVQIANPGGMPVNDRPGVLMVANLEGDHLVGS